MHKDTVSIILFVTLFALIMGCAIGYSVGVTETKSHYNVQLKLDMLKGNLDTGDVFDGSLSFFGQNFYVNTNGLLQIDNFNENLCQQLSQEGYNCQSGVLVTSNNIDPLVSGYETLKKAEASLESSNDLINELTS
jgi:hypothetical protein